MIMMQLYQLKGQYLFYFTANFIYFIIQLLVAIFKHFELKFVDYLVNKEISFVEYLDLLV